MESNEQDLVRTSLTESENLQQKLKNQECYRESKKEAKIKSSVQDSLVRTSLIESECLQQKQEIRKHYQECNKEAMRVSLHEQEECEEKQVSNLARYIDMHFIMTI